MALKRTGVFFFVLALFFICVNSHSETCSKPKNNVVLGELGPEDVPLFAYHTEVTPVPGVNVTSETFSVNLIQALISFVNASESGQYPDATIQCIEGGPGYTFLTMKIIPGPSRGYNYTISASGQVYDEKFTVTTYKTVESVNDPLNYSIIVPILNGEKWIDGCFTSISKQSVIGKLQIEISVFNDNSSDRTAELLQTWKRKFEKLDVAVIITENNTGSSKGVGFAKNAAVLASSGNFLCFQDIDDVMLEERLSKQYELANSNHNALIGCQFVREPSDSTVRFTKWANNLNEDQLKTQIYTSHGPTIIMPTWFCHKSVFHKNKGFTEETSGFPEDLDFFYKHLDGGGDVLRVNEILLIYNYHLTSTTFSVSSETIWNIRMKHLINNFISKCENGFTIWNAGKQGKKFFKSLDQKYAKLVKAFCDVDVAKIGKDYEMYCPVKRKIIAKIPILHFSRAEAPFIICVKLDMTKGEFENNLHSLRLKEGSDYVLFS